MHSSATEVYAASGRRAPLWFDLNDGAESIPIGVTTTRADVPRFRVRVTGSFEQRPGCLANVTDALGQVRAGHICRGECYYPSEKRRPITRIEIVRIRPQIE